MDQKPNPSSLSSISPAPAPAPALARAAAIQASLKQIVLHTAYALKARTHYVRLGVTAAVPDGQPGAHGAAGLASLGGECEKYLGLVRGLESYLLHAQAALQLELERAKARESGAEGAVSAPGQNESLIAPATVNPNEALGNQSADGQTQAQAQAAASTSADVDDADIKTPPPAAPAVPPASASDIVTPQRVPSGHDQSQGQGALSAPAAADQPLASQIASPSKVASSSGDQARSETIIIDSDDDDVPLQQASKRTNAGPIDLTSDSPPAGAGAAASATATATKTAMAAANAQQAEPTGTTPTQAQNAMDLDSDLFGESPRTTTGQGSPTNTAPGTEDAGADNNGAAEGTTAGNAGAEAEIGTGAGTGAQGAPSLPSDPAALLAHLAGAAPPTSSEPTSAALSGLAPTSSSSSSAPAASASASTTATPAVASLESMDFSALGMSNLNFDFSTMPDLPSFSSGLPGGDIDVGTDTGASANNGLGLGLGLSGDSLGLGALNGVDLSSLDFSAFANLGGGDADGGAGAGADSMGGAGGGGGGGPELGNVDLSALLASFTNQSGQSGQSGTAGAQGQGQGQGK